MTFFMLLLIQEPDGWLAVFGAYQCIAILLTNWKQRFTFLNMLVLLKWQGYEGCVFCVNCIQQIYGILDMAQAVNITRF